MLLESISDERSLPIFSSRMFKNRKEDNDKEIKDLTGMVQMPEQ